MTKHTSGPWSWFGNSFGIIGLAGDGNKMSDVLHGSNVSGAQSVYLTVANEADIRLIAASPDLLEACKEALEEFVPMITGLHPDNPALKKIQQAISKAEGAQ